MMILDDLNNVSKILDMTVCPPLLAQCGLRHTAYTHKLDVSYGLVWSGRNTRTDNLQPSWDWLAGQSELSDRRVRAVRAVCVLCVLPG